VGLKNLRANFEEISGRLSLERVSYLENKKFYEETSGKLYSSSVHIFQIYLLVYVCRFHHRVQNGSGAHPASYPMGTRGFFPGNKAAGA
jgi:hypothetical protein